MIFLDRSEAGRRLGARLGFYRDQQPAVLAVSRGAVRVATEIAGVLQAPLDVLVVRDLGLPGNPAVWLGAVARDATVLHEGTVARLGMEREYLDRLVELERREVLRDERRMRRDNLPLPLAGSSVILADDGSSSPAAAMAAVRSIRAQRPVRVIFAVPACSHALVEHLQPEVDAVIWLYRVRDPLAVGLWYRDFAQTTDDEVAGLLAQSRAAGEALELMV